jgi:nicotinamide mononucleotide transporter
MNDAVSALVDGLRQTSGMELAAVILALMYLILAVRENLWCWAAAGGSTLIYLFLFFEVGLYAESALQIYYLGMAGYGFHQWRRPTSANREPAVKAIIRWSIRKHVLTLTFIIAGTCGLGWALLQTDSQAPFLDAFTTCAALVTTYMVTQKVLENWIYWLVIDSAAIVLYLDRALYFTALLFGIYIVIVILGYWRWLKIFRVSQKGNQT